MKALQEALRLPTARESLELMAPEERARLEMPRDQGKWPEPLDEAFLQTLARARNCAIGLRTSSVSA